MDWIRHTFNTTVDRATARSATLVSGRQNASSSLGPSSPAQQRPRSLMITSDQEGTFTSLPSPLLMRQRNRSLEQSATIPRRARSVSTTAVPDSVLRRVETRGERPHARDIKCPLCFDQTIIFADQEQSRLFRRWFATYQSEDQREENQKEQYDLLFDHIRSFNQRYGTASLPPNEKYLCTTLRPPIAPEGRGHPSYAVICAVNALCDLLKVFHDLITQAPSEVSATIKDVLVLVNHIEILSRWPENCRCMTSHQLAEILLQFFVEIVTVYKKQDRPSADIVASVSHSRAIPDYDVALSSTPPVPTPIPLRVANTMPILSNTTLPESTDAPDSLNSDSNTLNDDPDTSFNEGEALERIITLVCEVLRRLADPTEEWVQHFQTWKIEPSPTNERNLWAFLSPQHTKDFQRNLIKWLLYFILHLQRDNAPPMTPLQTYAYFEAMHLLGALVWQCNVDYLLLQELAVLDLLTAFIGNQRLLLQWQLRRNIQGFAGEHCQMVRDEFRSRLFAWRIVFAMELAVPEMRDHFVRSVTRSNITELFGWTIQMSAASSINDDDDDSDLYEHIHDDTRTSNNTVRNEYIGLDQFPLLDVIQLPSTSTVLEKEASTLRESVADFQKAYEADHLSKLDIATPAHLFDTMPASDNAIEIGILFNTALSMLLVSQQRIELNLATSQSMNISQFIEPKLPRRHSTISMGSSESSLVVSDTPANSDLSPPFWSETFTMLYKVFENKQPEEASSPFLVRQHPMDRAISPPYAQLAFLSLLSNLVYMPSSSLDMSDTLSAMIQDRRQWCLKLCGEERIWDILLSESFYQLQAIYTENSVLRTAILQFIVYTAVVSRQSIQAQCSKLLTLLFIHRDDAVQAITVCRAILTVLAYHREAAQESLKQHNCLANLTILLRECAGVEEAAMIRSNQQQQQQQQSPVVTDDAQQQLTTERRRLFWVLLPLLDRLLLNHRELPF
ncbi:hypothetical protein BDF19DRAFT_413181 [Syncephalis fuscata]|nr:hypothetical protein BDF19DRAFT_413181 [Syncephalis fuscata]